MKLTLQRESVSEKSTTGRLFVNDKFECYTLEDPVREVSGQPVETWKIKGSTAIPVGTYQVIESPSPKRHGRIMRLLLDVPGFVGIQIHPGNTAEHTEGCILVGTYRESADEIRGSKMAYKNLIGKLQSAISRREKVMITIINQEA